MCQWMFTNFSGPFWGWTMVIGMYLTGILVVVALALFIVWLIKQIKK